MLLNEASDRSIDGRLRADAWVDNASPGTSDESDLGI